MDIPTLLSILISTIGIGVTVLLGINIWTSLSIDKRIKKIITSEVASLKEQNNKLRDQLKCYSEAIGERAIGDQYARIGATTNAFFNYINSLQSSFDANDNDLVSKNLDSCIDIIRIDPSCIIDDDTTKNNIDIIKNILLMIHDERSYELFSYFVSLSKNESCQFPPELHSEEESEEGSTG